MDIKRFGIISFASLALALLIYLVVGNVSFFKIKNIKIESKMEFLNQAEIKIALKKDVSNSFFTVSLSGIQEKLKSLPFVKEAKVMRVWPNSLKIKITEIEAIARVKVNKLGLYVLANNCKYLKTSQNKFLEFKSLPIVSIDKDELSNYEKVRICDTFNFISNGFVKLNNKLNLNVRLTQVNINSINSISCVLNNEVLINLGKPADQTAINLKISRLQDYIQKQKNINDFRYIDLRYTNGIAAK